MRIEIVNWEKYNPRTDVKSSSWFRMQNNFFTDPDFFDLVAEQKLVWVFLCCQAGDRMNSSITVNPRLAAALIHTSPDVVLATIKALAENGKIIIDSSLTNESDRIRSDTDGSAGFRTLRTDGRTDERTDERVTSAKADPILLFDLWATHRGPLPAIAKTTDKRRRKAASRLSEEPDPEYWSAIIRRLAGSPFATGQVKSERCPNGWCASFDWLVENDTNHVKVAEGRYDDSKPKPRKTKALTKDDV